MQDRPTAGELLAAEAAYQAAIVQHEAECAPCLKPEPIALTTYFDIGHANRFLHYIIYRLNMSAPGIS